MKKKILVLSLLALPVIAGLTACGENKVTDSKVESVESEDDNETVVEDSNLNIVSASGKIGEMKQKLNEITLNLKI